MHAIRANHGTAESEVPSINDEQRGRLSETFHPISMHRGNSIFRNENKIAFVIRLLSTLLFPRSPSLRLGVAS